MFWKGWGFEMGIYKYNGAGNDFILLPDFGVSLADDVLPALAVHYCDRSGAYGADGMMVLRKSAIADCRMLFFNSDGSKAEMCGNGARCLCRFCYEQGISGETQVIETPAGIVTGQRLSEDQYRIRLNSPTVSRIHRDGSYVELGDPGIPHLVLPRPEQLDRSALRDYARKWRFDLRLPRGANVNLYRLVGENCLELLTYERGVEDFTLACGTGTGATVYALTALGLVTGANTEVRNEGGTLYVDVLREDTDVALYLTGPAVEEQLPPTNASQAQRIP